METDLSQIIKSNQNLSDEHIQFFIYQILRGLKYIHSCGILHRDLKPRNLLVNANCDLKICDFGLSRVVIDSIMTSNAQLTDYIATRWYRAPEVILSWKQYTGAVDVWSVGCILAELMRRKVLLPATSEQEMMHMIIDLLGTPPPHVIDQVDDVDNREFLHKLPPRKGADFKELFDGWSNPDAIDLLEKMLVFDPQQRITVEEALAHPYMKNLHYEPDEPSGVPVSRFDFDFELYSLKTAEYKELIYEEIIIYHDEPSVHRYLALKEECPEGYLWKRSGKERLRTMYKNDTQLKIPSEEDAPTEPTLKKS